MSCFFLYIFFSLRKYTLHNDYQKCIQVLLQLSISYHGEFSIYSRNKVSYTSSSTTRRVGKESFLIKRQRPPLPPFPQWIESSQDSGGYMTVGAFETAVCRERSQEPASLLSSKSPGNCLNKQQPALF